MNYDIIIIDNDDDEVFMAEMLAKRAKLKTSIMQYESREKALAQLSKKNISAKVIILDLDIPCDILPDEFVYKIKNVERLKSTPIIIMSYHEEDDLPPEYRAAMPLVDGFVHKTQLFTDDQKRWSDIIDDYLLK